MKHIDEAHPVVGSQTSGLVLPKRQDRERDYFYQGHGASKSLVVIACTRVMCSSRRRPERDADDDVRVLSLCERGRLLAREL